MAKDQFGDFQTPANLADQILKALSRRGIRPASVIEPSCGVGSLLRAAATAHPSATLQGLDINPAYVAQTSADVPRAKVLVANFFVERWEEILPSLPSPLLIVGNPPWVTNADLSGTDNLPKKVNFTRLSGLDALTGKANFDISEWLLIRLTEAALASNLSGHLAFLVKVAVARKFLMYVWARMIKVDSIATYTIETKENFNASVDACLLVFRFGTGRSLSCDTFETIDANEPSSSFGYIGGQLVADVTAHPEATLVSGRSRIVWRSGVKHDCSKVMQLRRVGADTYVNGLNERVVLEPDYIFPMMKSSEVATDHPEPPSNFMVVTQRTVGQEIASIARHAPKTWAYLLAHEALLRKRGSSIYRNKPPFSIFGVGDYTFQPWKVAISGLYKKVAFRVVSPHETRPVVFDDTVYFVGCDSESEAHEIARLVRGPQASRFFQAFVFWDAKRPITADLLNRLDIDKIKGTSTNAPSLPFPNYRQTTT